MTLYNEVYKNADDFLEYKNAVGNTVQGKQIIVKSIIAEINTLLENKEICLFPCDIGLFYKLFSQLIPSNSFLLLDKSPKPLEYISSIYQNTNYTLGIADACKPFILDNQLDYFITILAIHLFDNLDIFLQNVFKNLKHGGEFFCVFLSNKNANDHIMNKFFKNTVNKFYSEKDIINKLKVNKFSSMESKPIQFEITIPKDKISDTYNKFSNSYLYKQKESEILRFQNYLYELSLGEELKIVQDYTLIKCKK